MNVRGWPVLIAGTAAIVVSLGSLAAGALAEGDAPAEHRGDSYVVPLPDKESYEESKVEQARLSAESEAERIAAARQMFNSLVEQEPAKQHSFLVSLHEPIPIAEFEHLTSSVHPVAAYTLLAERGTLHPIWGRVDATSSDSDPTTVTKNYYSFVTSRLELLEKARSEAEPDEDMEAINAQVAEMNALLRLLEQDGVLVFGFECACSAGELAEADNTTALEVKTAELVADGGGMSPIFPWDAQRDELLAAEAGE